MIPNGPSMVGYGPGGAAVVVTASSLKTAMEPMSFSTFLHDHMIICTYLYVVLGFGCDFVVFLSKIEAMTDNMNRTRAGLTDRVLTLTRGRCRCGR